MVEIIEDELNYLWLHIEYELDSKWYKMKFFVYVYDLSYNADEPTYWLYGWIAYESIRMLKDAMLYTNVF